MYFKEKKIDQYLQLADVIIFDMNGLIIDDEPIQLKATNISLKKYNISYSRFDWIERCVGRKAEEFIGETLALHHIPLTAVKSIIVEKEAAYGELLLKEISSIIRDGVLELILFISQNSNKKQAIASSASPENIELVIGPKGLDIKKYFHFIISGRNVEKSKPDPEIFIKIKRFFPDSEKYLVFEDSATGVIAAKNANMECIAVPNSFTSKMDFKKADMIITDLSKDAKIDSTEKHYD